MGFYTEKTTSYINCTPLDGCREELKSNCMIYNGDDLVCTDIKRGTKLTKVIEKLSSFICNILGILPLKADLVNGIVPLSQLPDTFEANKFIQLGATNLVGNALTISTGYKWILGQIPYSNIIPFEFLIPLASIGKKRIDIFVADKFNNFTRILGLESISNPVEPQTPLNTIKLTFILVSDSLITNPTPPIVGDNFIEKSLQEIFNINETGILNNYILPPNYNFEFQGSIAQVNSFSYDLGSKLFHGKRLSFKNRQGTPIIIINDPFNLVGNINFILKPNETIEFHCNDDGSFDQIGVDIANKENLSNKSNVLTPSITLYPTNSAVIDYITNNAPLTPDATTTVKGKIKLAGDLGGTADLPTVPNKANINSPSFTGIPTAPTASLGTNTTQLATTAFVANQISAPVSSTQNGIVNNISLQELGGVDKLINGVTIGGSVGRFNTILGFSALSNTNNGNANTAIGHKVLESNTAGAGNTGVGTQVLRINTTGANNTAMGYLSFERNATGNENTAIGYRAMQFSNLANNNVAIGVLALNGNSSGNHNVAIGYGAGVDITNESNNTFIGARISRGYVSNTLILGAGLVERIVVDATGKTNLLNKLNISNVPIFIDNNEAINGGLVIGDVYRTALGTLMIRI